ncbi:sigma-70 family RNA polymerase sigma factor [Belliella sp. DSM 107340]|uniref:Sigma-70 family RNA polymerase sigma factor n=1 Tax=Belliella calami TaxID=2923436 RepID=A0ABS9UNS5_9BACT|nr:sigma-70 family RNA polymerase sigma factor [Belliella calami]MCH7398271.1 sigma-70 family RNA polymerase sigma factor [Belliella calami]
MKKNEDVLLLTDEELAFGVGVDRNVKFFEELYNRFSKKVFNKCLSFVKHSEIAEDLTHDIFLQLFVTIRQFKGKSKFSTWLYSLTYNYCVNYLNRDKNAKMLRESVEVDDLKETSYDEDDGVFWEMESKKLDKALQKVTAEERMILLLKYQDDASIKDLQEVLEIGQSAVKMRLSRAKTNLLKEYKKIEYEY